MAEIAILIPIHAKSERHWQWLQEALDSIKTQSFVNYEVWVVDDSSLVPPPVFEGNVHYLRQDLRGGPGVARNIAARASSAPWLLPLDSDDQLTPGALDAFYNARCETEVIYGDLEWFGERTGYQRTFDYDPRHLRELTGPLPITALHSKKAWQAIGGWDEHLAGLEDLEYWIRLAELGICPRRIEAVTMRYRRRPDSRSRALELNKAREKSTIDEIRDKHRVFFGGQSMACSSCPGGTSPMSSIDPALLANAPDGWVEMKYMGLMQGGFFTPNSPISGNRYRVDGRGAYFFVDPRDVAWLANYMPRGVAEYERVDRVVAAPSSAPSPFVGLPELPELQTVSALPTKQALAAISNTTEIVDLRVMMAEEKTRVSEDGEPAVRKTIVTAIEKRMKQIEEANAASA